MAGKPEKVPPSVRLARLRARQASAEHVRCLNLERVLHRDLLDAMDALLERTETFYDLPAAGRLESR